MLASKSFTSCLPQVKKTSALLAAAALSLTLGTAAVQAQVNVLTQHNDLARTGQNLLETKLNSSNVNVAKFGKLFERPVDSNIWSQPLYVSNVAVPDKGTRNVVYVQTEVGQVYAFDADNSAETAPLWRRDLAPNDFSDSLSTPVIDLASKSLFCVVRRVDRRGTTDTADDQYSFTFHALDITTGLDKYPQKTITGSVAGSGKGSVNGRLSFRADTQKQRPALLLLKGVVYAAFGGGIYEYEPEATWNGWIFGLDAATGATKVVYAVSPDRNGGGIWQAANGLASDGTHIYTVTANGGNNPLATSSHEGGRDYGNSALKLTPNATNTALTVTDFWTPWDFLYMETADQDLGASGPLLIPGTNLLMTGDKTARMYVMNTTNMGKYTQGRNNIVQDVLAWKGHLHGGPVYWNSSRNGPLVYGWAEHDFMRAFKVLGNQGVQTTPVMKSNIQVPPGMPGGMLSISANGGNSGIVWATAPYIGDANVGIVPGVLRAFNADKLSEELWNSEIFSSRDKVGYYAKFAPPTIANGKVYVPSFYNPATFVGAKLIVYGLLPTVTKPVAPTNLRATAGMSKVDLAWNAVSGATSYTVFRGTVAGGPYGVLAKNLRTTAYEDRAIVNGTRYYYVVTASNSGGDSPNSNEANATPIAPNNGSIISVDFIGGGSNGTPPSMGATEKAGVIAASDWNSVAGGSGAANGLRALGGSPTSAGVTWQCDGTFSATFPDVAGNYRMMKGYLSNGNTTGININVTNIPSNITTVGYDVYVYVDGNNPTATRAGNFTIGTNTQRLADSQNRDFEGVFVPRGVADVGNYVVFSNLTASSFTLAASPADSTDGTRRCPINGFQIVARRNVANNPQPTAPTSLVANPGNNQVSLSWVGVAGATSYNVKRATVATGPFNVIGSGVTSTGFGDVTARNSTTYYYLVSAIVGGVESANSNLASARPSSSYVGRVISLDFGGGSTPAMGAAETAGADGVVRGNWNSTLFGSGGLGDVKDDTGAATTADVTWSGGSVGDTDITVANGPRKMMRGYIFPATNPATVNVFNLPATFTAKGYDVYVYFDNNNTGARTGRYAISGRSWMGTDAANTDFNNTFVLATNSVGNYVKLMGFNTTSFTLTATSVSSADSDPGAPINGIQIVARNAQARAFSLSPTSVTSTSTQARTLTAEYRDDDGNADILTARILVNTTADGATGLVGHYDAVGNRLYLVGDNGALIGGFAPGSANTITTTKGILNCAATTVTRSGTRLVVNWVITARAPMAGSKNVYLRAIDKSNIGLAWTKLGTWTISVSGVTKSVEEF